jgi:phosphate transport system substrate-binding protein
MAHHRCALARTLAGGIILAAAAVGVASAAMADPLVLQGSTTFSRRLMEPFQGEIEAMTGHQLTVIPNKSTPGLIALIEGRAHMAMLSAPLETEIELLQKSMPGLQFDKLRSFEVARTRVAIAVHHGNPVRAATLGQVTQILLGRIDNWSTLGGPHLPMRVILVGGGGGVTVAVEAALLSGRHAEAPNKVYVKTPMQLIQVVEQEPGAIGFAQLALVRQRKNIELTTDRPIEQLLYLVTVGEPTPAMRSVIDAARSVAAKAM